MIGRFLAFNEVSTTLRSVGLSSSMPRSSGRTLRSSLPTNRPQLLGSIYTSEVYAWDNQVIIPGHHQNPPSVTCQSQTLRSLTIPPPIFIQRRCRGAVFASYFWSVRISKGGHLSACRPNHRYPAPAQRCWIKPHFWDWIVFPRYPHRLQ